MTNEEVEMMVFAVRSPGPDTWWATCERPPGTIRESLGPFKTREEAAKAVDAMADLARAMGSKPERMDPAMGDAIFGKLPKN